MFKKKHRLAKTTDVQLALSRGRSFFNPIFTVKYLKRADGLRFTVVVSTKVSKRAVVRNRIKRIIREYIRLRMDGFASGDYVVMAKPAAAGLSADELRLKIGQGFNNSRLMMESSR